MTNRASSAVHLRAQTSLVSGRLRLDVHEVDASLGKEVTLITPQVTIRVTNDPVLHLRLRISAPADDGDRVVQLLPLDTTVHHGLLGDLVVALGQLGLLVVTELCKFDDSLMQASNTILSDDTLLVERSNSGELNLTVDGATVDDFLHDRFLGGSTVTLTNVLGVGDLDVGLAFLVVRAAVTLGLRFVLGALFLDKVSILAVETVE